jgi:hypothetical protein
MIAQSEIDRINAEREIDLEVYQECDLESRFEYPEAMANFHGLPIEVVIQLADLLTPTEDFDGLVTSCEDAGLHSEDF